MSREERQGRTATEPEPTPTPAPAPEPKPDELRADEPRALEPSPQDAARQAKAGITKGSRKEDVVTVTPVVSLPKEDMTVGGRYEKATQDRIARRDGAVRYNVAVCPNCGHEEELPAGSPPRTTYGVCPVCGDTLRWTGAGIRDAKAEPLPPIADDEQRSVSAA